MNNSLQTAIFKKLDNIFIILLSSQLFLIITSFFIASNNYSVTASNVGNELRLAIMIITLTAVVIVRGYYNSTISKIKLMPTLDEKIDAFYAASINRLAVTEILSLINLITFLTTTQYVFIIISIILFILFIVYRPTEKVFESELNK
ncbi:MAG: hypothetical protein HND52_08300 [Ignavibacteriae bacterium]|nr:hypothetical protein [Ignavibacteriota bacterium]